MDSNMNYKIITNFVICISVVGLVMALTGTYSYFSKENTYNVTGSVVNWAFSANNNTETFAQTLNDIYPGNSGSFILELNATSSTTDISCTVEPAIANELTGMLLYQDEEYNNQITKNNPITQTVAAGTNSSITVYWKWDYDTGLLPTQSVSFSINVTGKQIIEENV